MGEPQVFYTHIMKTGGTSLSRALHAHFGPERSYPREVDGPAPITSKTFTHLLLDMDPAERDGYRCFCVHQPAWVAFEIAPDACKLVVLREPVARTVSHLRQLAESSHAPDDLRAIYADPTWRARLTNHQTQFLADRRDRAPATADIGEPDLSDPLVREELREALARFWETAIETPFEVKDEDYAHAVATLERYDVVGITEQLDLVRDRLTAAPGITIPPLRRQNTTKDRTPVPDDLLARIEADNRYDLALYAHARRLAGA